MEGIAYTPDGTILTAIESRNRSVPVSALPGDPIDVYIEAASNPDLSENWSFAPSPLGEKSTAGGDPSTPSVTPTWCLAI